MIKFTSKDVIANIERQEEERRLREASSHVTNIRNIKEGLQGNLDKLRDVETELMGAIDRGASLEEMNRIFAPVLEVRSRGLYK